MASGILRACPLGEGRPAMEIARFSSNSVAGSEFSTIDGDRIAQAIRDTNMNTNDIAFVKKALHEKFMKDKHLSEILLLEEEVKEIAPLREGLNGRFRMEARRNIELIEKFKRSRDKKSSFVTIDLISLGSVCYAAAVAVIYVLQRK